MSSGNIVSLQALGRVRMVREGRNEPISRVQLAVAI